MSYDFKISFCFDLSIHNIDPLDFSLFWAARKNSNWRHWYTPHNNNSNTRNLFKDVCVCPKKKKKILEILNTFPLVVRRYNIRWHVIRWRYIILFTGITFTVRRRQIARASFRSTHLSTANRNIRYFIFCILYIYKYIRRWYIIHVYIDRSLFIEILADRACGWESKGEEKEFYIISVL